MSTETKGGAVDRLRAVIEAAERNPDNLQPWQSYLRTLADDLPWLVRAGSTVDVLLMQMRAAGGKGSGWSSRAETVGDALAKAKRSAARPVDPSGLDLGSDGRPRATLSNAERVLASDPSWVGQVRLNQLTDVVEIGGEATKDTRVTEIAISIDRSHGLTVDERVVGRVLRLVGERNGYHPVRDYLGGLVWDGVKRVDGLLEVYFKAATPEGEQRVPGDEGSPLLEALSRRWMVSAVARAMRPGCKVDTVLILQGGQGQRKSTGLAVLGGAWFRDTRLDIGNKDAYQQARGVWIYEIQEIDGMLTRKHADELKAFVSSQTDSYRRPYAENVEDVPRGCVFSGTTNRDAILTDPTGSRRFWPVRVTGLVDTDALRRDRDQLWAEAVHLYHAGTPWHLSEDEEASLVDASDAFRAGDVWEGAVLDAAYSLAGGQGFTTAEVLSKIGVTVDKQGEAADARVRRILTDDGWVSRRCREGSTRLYRWRRKGAEG